MKYVFDACLISNSCFMHINGSYSFLMFMGSVTTFLNLWVLAAKNLLCLMT